MVEQREGYVVSDCTELYSLFGLPVKSHLINTCYTEASGFIAHEPFQRVKQTGHVETLWTT